MVCLNPGKGALLSRRGARVERQDLHRGCSFLVEEVPSDRHTGNSTRPRQVQDRAPRSGTGGCSVCQPKRCWQSNPKAMNTLSQAQGGRQEGLLDTEESSGLGLNSGSDTWANYLSGEFTVLSIKCRYNLYLQGHFMA